MEPIVDDTSKGHTTVIKQVYYVPEAPLSLLCPQKWAKQCAIAKGTKDAPKFITMASNAKLSWNQEKMTITIPYDQVSNLPISWTEPGNRKLKAYTTKLYCMPAGVISDGKESSDSEGDSVVSEQPPSSEHPREMMTQAK